MPVDVCGAALWLALATGTATPKTTADAPAAPEAALPDMELLEFLGSFETDTGPWPELNEHLSTRAPTPIELPKEETKR